MTNLLTLEEAAARLRKTPAQLRWMRHAGTAPRCAKIGGRIMFKESDLDEYIETAFAEAS